MTHAGDIDPSEALEVLRAEPDAVLVDVRTSAEWAYVGLPDLRGIRKATITIEWNHTGGGHNSAFLEELQAAGVDKDAAVLFLCRSGARSAAAADAATQHGWSRAHNISGGFEGGPDGDQHRGTVEGWKAEGLPWVQS